MINYLCSVKGIHREQKTLIQEKGECKVKLVKITEKQKELIDLAIKTEEEIKDKVYFEYNYSANKVYLFKIDSVEDKKIKMTYLKPTNPRIAKLLEKKGVIIREKINDHYQFLTLNKDVMFVL